MRRLLPVLFALLVGGAVGFLFGKRQPTAPPPYLPSDISLIRMNRPAEQGVPTRFRPYCITTNGVTQKFGEPPESPNDTWIINDGRVVIGATPVTE